MDKTAIIIAGVGIALVLLLLAAYLLLHRKKSVPMDEMEGHDFEQFCAGLLRAERVTI